ncbi:hypothetical protein B5E84_05015 [Lachnoclostridium sp. An14]|uniref:BMP family lipoprotein n=1 Tax=Lachnoclostridium sp. An14 TaxID=1965562 RepID=UPI000B36EEB1|nr:BMP family protein [Lachnoclostridium sp. An14]OUQ20098.1 hypothetical protein B5E84_05015 [Lachnoclostridium sp. An14]
MVVWKRILAIGVCLAVATGSLTGCGAGGEEDDGTVTVALLADGAGFGTQSFNDVALEGLQRAEQELGIKLITLEVKEVSDLQNSLRSLAQLSDMIITPSSTVKDAVIEVSQEFPDVYFGLLDMEIEGYENIASSSYREQEAGFLLGALGAKLTQTGQIAYVGGVSGVIQDRCQWGYTAGAYYIDPDVKVTSTYVGSFSDVGKGLEIASALYSSGCDYIAPFAGAANLGVFRASSQAGEEKWAFGAANGQFNQMPDKIVASQVKRVDNVAYSLVESLLDGTLKGNEPQNYGVKEGGVDLMYSTEPVMQDFVPQEIKDEIDELRDQVIAGEIDIPVNQEEFETWVAAR